jgi:hypothetical protein
MNNGLIFVCCFFGGVALLPFVIWKVMDFIDKRNDRKHHKEHPEFFRLYDDYSDKGDTACRFYNTEIAPCKRKVKAMLEEEPYWPQEVRGQKMEEVEKLRREIYTGECMYKGLNKEMKNARQKVVDYVQTHGIKWAGVWE